MEEVLSKFAQKNAAFKVDGNNFQYGYLFFLIVAVAYTLVIIQNSWIAEDAYITLRTVGNFLHGFGLRWNIAERVQSYTHPLWFFLLSFGVFVTNEVYYTVPVSQCT